MAKTGEKENKNKGGRPKKAIRKNRTITVKCSSLDKLMIRVNAQTAKMTVSEFLRELGLNRKIDSHIKELPKEVLEMRNRLNQIAANLNQVAKKKNMGEPFNALERAEAAEVCLQVKQTAQSIIDFFKK
jgi:SAM-dependent MidA family methyltransferase